VNVCGQQASGVAGGTNEVRMVDWPIRGHGESLR
jgi:hypothetical protein